MTSPQYHVADVEESSRNSFRFLAAVIGSLAVGLGPWARATAQMPFGTPTAGASGIPLLLTAGHAWMGNAGFGFQVTQGPAGALVLLVVSLAPAPLAGGLPGVLVSLDPPHIVSTTTAMLSGPGPVPGQGSATFNVPLSFAPMEALAGRILYAQAGIIDGGIATSNGVLVELTFPPLMVVATSRNAPAVGSSFAVIDPATQTLVTSSGPEPFNVNGMDFGRGGRDLFVASGTTIEHASTLTLPLTWSTITSSPTLPLGGVAWDRRRNLLYTVRSASGNVQLVAIAGDPSSAAFGTIVGTGAFIPGSLPATNTRAWALASAADRAVLVLSSGLLSIIDTNLASPTWLQPVQSSGVPGVQGGLFVRMDVEITPDGRVALVHSVQQLGVGLHRFDVMSGTWIDHNPSLAGIQPLGPSSSPPVNQVFNFGLSRDGRAATILSNDAGGSFGVVFFDPTNPSSFGYAPIAAPLLGRRTVVSPDNLSIAFVQEAAAQFLSTSTLAPLGPVIPFPGEVTLIAAAFR